MTTTRRTQLPFYCFLLVCLLSGCSSLNHSEELASSGLEKFFLDQAFSAASPDFALEPAPQFLELPDNYKRELDRLIADSDSEHDRYKKLRSWVFRKFDDYDFDVLETSSLLELNNNRKINCLSFSTFFVAAARYKNIPADFQLVFAPPYWDQQNGSWINNQHINVTGLIERPDELIFRPRNQGDGFPIYVNNENFSKNQYRYVADVNPAVVSVRIRRRVIDEEQVLFFFYSNKSIEALLQEDLATAYQYTRAALETYPESALAWNNLGVLYKRVNQNDLAITAYNKAIAIDENAYSAKSNLARLYRLTGEIELANVLDTQVAAFRNQNPYYHSALADESLDAGDLEQAKVYLETALDRKHNEHHFYHQLAMVNQALGETDAMMENLRSARRYARGQDKARFSNKLEALEELLTAR